MTSDPVENLATIMPRRSSVLQRLAPERVRLGYNSCHSACRATGALEVTENASPPGLQTLGERARQLAQAGNRAEAGKLYAEILARAPEHVEALGFVGVQALAAGRVQESIACFQRALALAPQDAATWKNLALAQGAKGDYDEALSALDQALGLSPVFPAALLNKGALLEQIGRDEEAVAAYLRALGQMERAQVGKPDVTLPPRLDALFKRAQTITNEARKRWVLNALQPLRDAHGDKALARVDHCLKSHFGDVPEQPSDSRQQPTFLYFPGIPSRGWFERAEFPWLANIEEQTGEIRREMLSVLQGDEGFRPFVEMPKEHPGAAHWKAVNQSTNWNAYFFYRDGERFEDNCRRCPITAAALDSIPISRVAEHSPEAFYSVLKPGVHIPIHTGVVNIRLVTHLPLIIPPACGISVGGETRGWHEGQCITFDDTWEHEAWNDSDTTRVVLIFDIWNPYLTEIEQQAMRIVIEGFGNFSKAHAD